MDYLFEDYRLDPDRRELRRRREPIAVEPLVFDLLLFLIRNRERVVSKDELIAGVWRGRIVSDSTLMSRMNAARHAIGDSGAHQRLIKTISRKGHRFVGEVREEKTAPALPRSDAAPLVSPSNALDSSAPSLPDKPSIAVLSFTNLSRDPAQDYFADGMVEDVTVALARIPQLFVIGGRSASAYKNRSVDTRQVGKELGVRYILQGSVRRDGDQIRITAQLTDAMNGRHIWADRFEGEMDSVFAMQDRVATRVSAMIAPAVRTAEIAHSERKPTTNLTAYDLFLQASRNPLASFEASEIALQLLYRAIALDSRYAAAHALAAYVIRSQKVFGWILPSDPKIAEGTRLARLAFEGGRDDSEALSMLASAIFILDGDIELARSAADRALLLNPSSPLGWWASGLASSFGGDPTTGLDHLAHARRLNPFDPLVHDYWMATAMSYFFAAAYEEAEHAADKSLTENSIFAPALRMKIVCCALLGRTEAARGYVRRLLAINPSTTVSTMREYFGPLIPRSPSVFETYFDALRRSGIPEH